MLKCVLMGPKWLILWDLSLFLFTPQFIKETLQQDKKLGLSGFCLARRKLREGGFLVAFRNSI